MSEQQVINQSDLRPVLQPVHDTSIVAGEPTTGWWSAS